MQQHEFAQKWRELGPKISERAGYQEHWRDLCSLLNEPTPSSDETGGERYAFEKHVKKAGTREPGFADVYLRGHFIVEYKGAGAALGGALRQALLYARELGNPPLLVLCDFLTIEIHTNFTGAPARLVITLDDIAHDRPVSEDLTALAALRLMFRDPERFDPRHLRERVTTETTARLGLVTRALRARGVNQAQAAHFLIRLVFTMFAEDVGLLPRDLLTRVLTRARKNPARSQAYLQELFGSMEHGGEFWDEDIRHFNGGLFDSEAACDLTADEAAILMEVARFDWRSVEPAIFGTLFEQGLDAPTRALRGAHFTAVPDIVRLTGPVIMRPMQRAWAEVRATAQAALGRGSRAGREEAATAVRAFQRRLGEIRVLDPACGSGNFLVVTLTQLLDLEQEVRLYGFELGLGDFDLPPVVHPRQMLGLEIESFARELASVTIWIAFFQWKAAHGGEWSSPVLETLGTVREQDALLTPDLQEAVWPEADFIVGNPPFMGDKTMRDRLGDPYTEALRMYFRGRLPAQSDLVCYWVQKAWEQVQRDPRVRAGFVTTNSIRTGSNREVLNHITAAGQIFAAWPDEPWLQGDAAVRVSLFAFDHGQEPERTLNGQPVERITPSLTGGVDVTVAQPLAQNASVAFIGGMKKGNFVVADDVAQLWLAARNPDGALNNDVLKPWVNGMDLTRRRSFSWIIDFADMDLEEAQRYVLPFAHVEREVRPARELSGSPQERAFWWRHGRMAPDLRRAVSGLPRFIGIPRVARYLLPVWLEPPLVVDGQVVVVARDDDFTLGVLLSAAHRLWARAQGSYMGVGNDLRYTPQSCFETFPFPAGDTAQRAEVERLAQAVTAARSELLRAAPGETLTGVYHAVEAYRASPDLSSPVATLAEVHIRLDAAVAACYGWAWPLTGEEVLGRLLALNLAAP